MIKEIELAVPPDIISEEELVKKAIASALHIPAAKITGFYAHKRSIDARSRQVVYRTRYRVFIDEPFPGVPVAELKYPLLTKDAPRVLIVGAGPAGLFAALRCIELGWKPLVLERGKDVKKRRRDLARINKEGIVNPESNYCYGEGGAGTYSDGKLYTRSTKRGDVDKILGVFVHFGADPDIMVNARPHIGTNKLPQIIVAMREQVIASGGEVRFQTKVSDLLVEENRVKGVQLENGEMIHAAGVILATGHSARDIYEMLHRRNIKLEAKPFALGVRIEHPQEVIDQVQYHCDVRHPNLPPAYYSIVEQVEERGIFSFCMCPGGIIAPCATEEEEVVVNGWSPSKRNNPYANSGLVVQLNLEDIPGDPDDPLFALKYQKEIERKAFIAGGSGLQAPAQRIIDFVERRISESLPQTSYLPGVVSVQLDEVLPPHVSERLRKALPAFGKKMKGYYTNEGVLVGVESRTSSPVRIPRDKESLEHIEIKGLFPCGEGAGYAGGIISAAIDGEKCAEALVAAFSASNY
jgi:uncharacterized FAD-dependent dehydrogenase